MHAATEFFKPLAQKLRAGRYDVGRLHYAQTLMYGVAQAWCMGIDRISALEFGVWKGGGLVDLHKAAKVFEGEVGVKTDIFGFDTFGAGLGAPQGYKDHPEIWFATQFELPNPDAVKAAMPEGVELVVGDVAETVAEFEKRDIAPIGFMSIDVDYYSSTPPCLNALRTPDPERLLPAVPMHINDIDVTFTYNSWCGEALAIQEFNDSMELRKIERSPAMYQVSRLHAAHILDHPIRTGAKKPKMQLILKPW